jgi:hypothetical protein
VVSWRKSSVIVDNLCPRRQCLGEQTQWIDGFQNATLICRDLLSRLRRGYALLGRSALEYNLHVDLFILPTDVACLGRFEPIFGDDEIVRAPQQSLKAAKRIRPPSTNFRVRTGQYLGTRHGPSVSIGGP